MITDVSRGRWTRSIKLSEAACICKLMLQAWNERWLLEFERGLVDVEGRITVLSYILMW